MEEQEDQKAQKQPEATRHHFVAGDIAKIDDTTLLPAGLGLGFKFTMATRI